MAYYYYTPIWEFNLAIFFCARFTHLVNGRLNGGSVALQVCNKQSNPTSKTNNILGDKDQLAE
jgi:hypothetical protein